MIIYSRDNRIRATIDPAADGSWVNVRFWTFCGGSNGRGYNPANLDPADLDGMWALKAHHFSDKPLHVILDRVYAVLNEGGEVT
jgi:hypothetical protein